MNTIFDKPNRNLLCMRRYSLLGILLFLIGCGSPVYQMEYKFELPDSQHGRNCVAVCERGKQRCLSLQELNYNNCEQIAEANYAVCESQNKNCLLERCERSSIETCAKDFRNCYAACEGRVIAEQVCVDNCE